MGLFKKTIADYNNALKTECNNYAIWIKLGIDLYNRFEPEKAIVCYERAFKLRPDNYLGWTALADGFYILGRHEKAIYCYEQAVKIDKNKNINRHEGDYNGHQ